MNRDDPAEITRDRLNAQRWAEYDALAQMPTQAIRPIVQQSHPEYLQGTWQEIRRCVRERGRDVAIGLYGTLAVNDAMEY